METIWTLAGSVSESASYCLVESFMGLTSIGQINGKKFRAIASVDFTVSKETNSSPLNTCI